MPTMLITEPPFGRRTARAAFAVDVLVAPALLPVEDAGVPAPAVENVIVGAAYETEQTKISVMKRME